MREVSISEAWARKYPEQIVFATSVGADGRPNIIVLGWAMPTSGSPPMVAISVGHTRYSYETIRASRDFVVAFPAQDMVDSTIHCGSHSGRDGDKFGPAGLSTLPARHVKAPLVAGCVANFECSLVSEHKTGDHSIFVGEIVTAHVEDGVERLYNLGQGKFGPVVPGCKGNRGKS